jgi:hypothetical protein
MEAEQSEANMPTQNSAEVMRKEKLFTQEGYRIETNNKI